PPQASPRVPLTFVGLGLWDQKDVSLRGLEAIRAADVVYGEWYTAFLGGAAPDDLVAFYGRPVEWLTRDPLEKGDAILEAARAKDVVLLAVGDSMTATTHVDLRVRAQRMGIPTRVVHGASIATAAAGLLGLFSYKFGRATTVVYPEGNYFPTSPYDVIRDNRARGLHTLALLDLRAAEGRHMSASEGAALLLRMERERAEGVLAPETEAYALARAGSPQPVVARGTLEALSQADLGPPLHTLVVPGKLHFVEEEAVQALAEPVA
ncbi:MAG TPA: diphthine synthase, partial [Candidatus Thermoplasmatota archaeon]|nr:diphthine synthase [Candidatus Thermoplasmatota archaeon]